jgi:Predicted AAA-ATPase
LSPAEAARPRKKLPVGIQTLAKLHCQGCYYVDKSGLPIDLIESGSYFFLSRPRRFSKSLVVDTFKELFEGNRALFEGLAAETRWDWSQRYPVIRISSSDGMLKSRILVTAHLESEARIACQAIN